MSLYAEERPVIVATGFDLIHRTSVISVAVIGALWALVTMATGNSLAAWIGAPLAAIIIFAPALIALLSSRIWVRTPKTVSERRTAALLMTAGCAGIYLVTLFGPFLDATTYIAFSAASFICLTATVQAAYSKP